MDDENLSKRRLYRFLGWIIVGIYIALNISILGAGVPFAVLAVVLPIINLVLISAWIFVRFLFNKANDPVKHSEELSLKTPELVPPKYGDGNGSTYEPDVKVSPELFNSISTEPNDRAIFDITMKDYLKTGQIITFHNELDYGTIKKVRVLEVSARENGIEASFSNPSS